MFWTPRSPSNLDLLMENCLQYMDIHRFESQFFCSLTSNPLYLNLLITNMGLINLDGHKVVLNINKSILFNDWHILKIVAVVSFTRGIAVMVLVFHRI